MKVKLIPSALPKGTRLVKSGKVREGDWVLSVGAEHPLWAEWVRGSWSAGNPVRGYFAVARQVRSGRGK